jgi:arginase family enzyme
MLKTIYEKHGDLKERYDKILALGGDHTVSFPIVKAFLDNQPLTYLYFDAHLDYYKDSSECYNWNVVEKIQSSGVEVINVGFRDILDCTDQADLKIIPIIENFKLRHIIDQIRQLIPNDRRVYVSIDLDILDPLIFPYVNSPVQGGLLSRELLSIVNEVLSEFRPIGIDIVEYNPMKDPSDTGAHFVRYLVDYILQKWG